MLRVVDLQSGTSLSCSLTAESTAAQVVVALKKRRSLFAEDDSTFAMYGVWTDSKQRVRAKRLRGDDKPLLLVGHLKRTTGTAPKLSFTSDGAAARLILAKTTQEDEARVFGQNGIILDGPNDSEFFTVIQRLGPGDVCGYLFTNSSDMVTKKTESSLKWWVLQGERLWFQSSHEDDVRFYVALANNKVLGPWNAELELQTSLNAYRLIASSAVDARTWVDSLESRIRLATDNELIACADVIIADEEKVRWKRIESRLARLETLDGWCESDLGINQLSRFARTDGSEYLLLFYVDGTNAMKSSATINYSAIIKRFMALAALPPNLQVLKMELSELVSNGGVTRSTVDRVLADVKTELDEGLMVRFKRQETVFDRSIAEMAMLAANE